MEVPVTDEGLQTIANMKGLESLYLDGGHVSDAALEKLIEVRPALHLHQNQQHLYNDPQRHTHPE
jgi:hypothetical protein